MALIALGILLPAPPAAAADFVEWYKLGLEAFDSGDYARTEEMMQKAIDLQPKPKPRVKKSLFFKRYLPYFHLGMARYQAGDCDGAVQAWQAAQFHEVVTRFEEYEQLRQGRTACEQRVLQLESQRQDLERRLDLAKSSAASLRKELEAQIAAGEASLSDLESRVVRSEAALQQSTVQLAAAGDSPAALDQTSDKLVSTESQVAALRREWDQWSTAVQTRRAVAEADLNGVVTQAESALERSAFLQPYPAGIEQRRQTLQSLIDQVGAAERTGDSARLTDLKVALDRAVTELNRAAAPPPAELVAAAEAHVAGEYAAVLDALQGVEYSTKRGKVHVQMLTGAALFAMSQMAAETDQDLLAEARSAVLSCRRADPVQRPPSSMFSPRFIDFFEEHAPASEQPEINSTADDEESR